MTLHFKFGGPIHYLGNRLTKLPNQNGKMMPDRLWFNKMLALLRACDRPIKRIIEPFSGSASFCLGMMEANMANEYIINDTNTALIEYLSCLKNNPSALVDSYSRLEYELKKNEGEKHFLLELIDTYNNMDFYNRGLMLPFIVNHLWSGLIVTDKNQNIVYIPPDDSDGILSNPILDSVIFEHEVKVANYQMNKYQVTLLNDDFECAILDINPNDFIMMNPPYPENMRNEESGMYVEIHQPGVLHEKIIHAIEFFNQENSYYAMTYGFYNPEYSHYIIQSDKLQRFLYLIGGSDCAFGESLDQLYISSNIHLNEGGLDTWVSAEELDLCCYDSKQDALDKYCTLLA